MSSSLRIRLKLLTIYYLGCNKSSNHCLYRLMKISDKSSPNNLTSIRSFSHSNNKTNTRTANNTSSALSQSQTAPHSELTIGQKVKQTTQDISYLAIICGGVSVTCIILYAIFRELFSASSPQVIYSNALKRCKSDPRVIEAIGHPIKGFGEMTNRGRRRRVSSFEYEKDGNKWIRVQFYLKGSKGSATVHLETNKNRSKPEFRYLFVQLDYYPNTVIVLEDNRSTNQSII